jgi:hypothetical protein
MRTPDAAMRTSPSHVYYPWQVSYDGDFKPTGTSPERTKDSCCHYLFKTSFQPDGSVGAEGARQIQQGPQPKELPRLPRPEG